MIVKDFFTIVFNFFVIVEDFLQKFRQKTFFRRSSVSVIQKFAECFLSIHQEIKNFTGEE